MNSLEIQYFLTIVKYGSFTEAAQALSVSQPAISKQIRQLEAELGCSLFTRSGRTLSLTEAGQAYHAYFQQCRFQLDLLKTGWKNRKDGKPTIRIAYPEDVDPSYFRDKIQNAAAAMRTPVRLEFSCYPEAELTNLLTDGKIDLILTGTRPDEAGQPLSGHPFFEVPQVLLYASTRPEAPDISDFRNEHLPRFRSRCRPEKQPEPLPAFPGPRFCTKIRFAANLSTILDLTAQDEGVYLTHAWCRACKNRIIRCSRCHLQKFYLACRETTQKQKFMSCFADSAIRCNPVSGIYRICCTICSA